MDTDKIIQDLLRRFAAPLPEFYTRRIIFWYDEDREFEEQIDELELDNVRILKLTGSNNFEAKKLLAVDDLTSNFLVYQPQIFNCDDDNWMLNIQLYSEEFHCDQASIWASEMGLESSVTIRNLIKDYRKFFGSKERRAKVAPFASTIKTAGHMHLAIMAVLSGQKALDHSGILRAVLSADLDISQNELYQSFVTYGAAKPFWDLVAKLTGYSEGEDSSLYQLAKHIILTATSRTLSGELLRGLDGYISTPHQAYCYDFVSDWIYSHDCKKYRGIARFVEDECKIRLRMDKLSVDDILDTETLPSADEGILAKIMQDISNQTIQVDIISSVVEKRRTMAWYQGLACYYDAILQVAKMQGFYLEHSAGFHLTTPAEIWKEYTEGYYLMDSYYRQFHLNFQRGLVDSNPLLDDLFKHVADQVEGLYAHWFLGGLCDNWANVCAEQLQEYGTIVDVPQQTDFYRRHVSIADNRIYVIVSDGLRYEVAATLAQELRQENQCKAELQSMVAKFPAVTKFGMAALLPHKKLEVVAKPNGLQILADEMSTESPNREKVLCATKANSTVLMYKNINGMKRDERSALVKGMDVVYIYHDNIDKMGHNTENMVFDACNDTIAEIKNIIRMITNDFGGTNILITADHGFLYTYSPFEEDSKVDKSTPSDMDVEVDRRYLIAKKGVAPEHLLSVKFTDEYDGFATRGNTRIKKKGGGLNYVHGGISLQEMVVPVISYYHLRNNNKTYQRNKEKYDTKPVELSLLSSSHKVSNMIFSLNFYQKEPVGDNRCKAEYKLYFEDAYGNQISDISTIIADKTSDNSQERTFRCSFSLKSVKFSNQEKYYLVIEDASGEQLPVKEEFQIDIAFAFEGFDF